MVLLVADGIHVVAGGRDQKIQRLFSRVTGALRHDIKQLPVGLSMKLIEHHAADVEAVLGIGFRGQHLVEAVRGRIDDALGRRQNLHPAVQRGTHPHHVSSHIEHNAGLSAVRSAAIDLRAFLAIATAEQQRHRGGKLAFPLLLGYLHIRRRKLTVPVRFERTEDVPNDFLLPVDQLEGLVVPFALGMFEAFDEGNRVIRGAFVIVGTGREKLGGLVFFQYSRCRSPPDGIRKRAEALL